MSIAGLDMEKTSSVAPNTSVNVGDSIIYTVTLKNTGSNTLEAVAIADVIPNGTEFVSGSDGVIVTDSTLSWLGNIAAGETVNVFHLVIWLLNQ